MLLKRLRIYLFGLNETELQEYRAQAALLPTPDGGPVPMPADPEADALPAVKNWSHPFRDKNHSLHQLTHLAKAAAGFYPLGVNGLWHGGVHFDGGTAGTVDQSSVHCLADGEVVAYRIDQRSPTTGYIAHKSPVLRPFSRNFVLVRHRLQPPKIDGSPDIPPSLIVYSLYMHLQDWAVYQQDPDMPRPGFWPEGVVRQVKMTVNDVNLDNLNERGLNVRNQAQKGKIIGFLPRGAKVTVSGTGDFRTLENTLGPDKLKNPDGSLQGYVAARHLQSIGADEYRVVTQDGPLTVRAEADRQSSAIGVLQQGTEVKVSGEGDYRKLEHVNQYVHFDSLQGVPEPLAQDRVAVLDQPVPIKAGDLIGHIGLYQDSHDDPEKRLHLEVFSGDRLKPFIEASRAWVQRLPATSRTWLKLVKGTAVVAHQERFSDKQPPTLKSENTPSDADLLVPKSLLDGLPAAKKIKVPATSGRNACIWYRIEGLLHDAEQTLLDGWVCEEVGVTPWVSPWAWENYDFIYNYDGPRTLFASHMRATGQFNEAQLERWGPVADMADTGPLKIRLYDILDRNRDGTVTAKEIQAAISLPAHAQSIAQLIIFAESEWCYRQYKWDSLDEPSGHTSSTPHLNWFSEKDRIREISWWGEVAEKLGLRADGKVHHFHPVGLVGSFGSSDKCECGCCHGPIFLSTRYGKQYGPVYWGNCRLADFKNWSKLFVSGAVTTVEREILVAMSENEGNLDSLQSYDSEILTAGAMQKTINPKGAGELPIQVNEFRLMHPDLYRTLFVRCGWEVKTEGRTHYLTYNGITGDELKALIREGFDQEAFEYKRKISSKPLSAFLNAITHEAYMAKQIIDFVKRLRNAQAITPAGYGSRVIGDYITSKLGKAVVLDHHVNRPGNVARDFGAALEKFFAEHPEISQDPENWGVNHAKHESSLLDIYGPSRQMTDAGPRYQNLRHKL